MDLQSLLLFALAVVTALLLCLERWHGSQRTSATPGRAGEAAEVRTAPVEEYAEYRLADVTRTLESDVVVAACMEVRANICQPKIQETFCPTAEIEDKEHDKPDSL